MISPFYLFVNFDLLIVVTGQKDKKNIPLIQHMKILSGSGLVFLRSWPIFPEKVRYATYKNLVRNRIGISSCF